MRNAEECQSRCSDNAECGYYKYFESSDVNQPLFCYHLRKCAPRVIRRAECPLEKNNYIDHFLFVDTQTECKQKCQEHTECRFWYWYPIDYSPAPMYCYLYRSCEGGADEQVSRRSFWTFNPFSTKVLNTILIFELPIYRVFKYFKIVFNTCLLSFFFHTFANNFSFFLQYSWYLNTKASYCQSPCKTKYFQTIGVIMGGRHPGYYFKTETSDLVKSDIICPKTNNNESINIGRGGAVAELVSPDIVLCGGRDRMNQVMDTCSKYSIKDHMWEDHSQLLVPREEAASAVLAGQVSSILLPDLI